MEFNDGNPRPPMTVAEYLAFEEASSERHEYLGGEVYPLGEPEERPLPAGETVRHNRIAGNVYRKLADAADSAGLLTLFGEIKLQAADNIIYYPDAMVAYTPTDLDAAIITNPLVVVEVLSDSTRTTDLREKLMFYRQVDSLETYLIVEQYERKVYRHWRDDERLWWSDTVVRDRRIPLPCLDIELSLDDIYRNLPETS